MRARGWRWLALTAIAAACLLAPRTALAQTLRGVLGANKIDLLTQYLGTASSQDGSAAARSVTVAMARKAIADAHDLGFSYVRVMAAGFGPVAPPPAGNPAQNDLALWQADPARYWSRIDAMFTDLDAAGLRLVPTFVWNPMQFPALVGDTVADMVDNPASRSRALLKQYVGQFIARYKARRTILFYELTNELNLEADIDIRTRCLAELPAANCAAYANFTSAHLTEFAGDMARWIAARDPAHAIGSGYSLPRPAAFHLATQPDFSAKGPDWTADTPAQFRAVMATTGAPFDLWSVHIYPGNVRWGNPAGTEAATLAVAAAAARAAGKRLYLGEFGDSSVSPYLTAMLCQLARGGVAYASVWVWEFYQRSTWQSASVTSAPPMSLEPGFSDPVDMALMRAAGGQRHPQHRSVHVVVTSPLPGATVAGPAELYATASVSGAASVGRVVFTIDGAVVGTATQAPFHVTVPARPAGTRSVPWPMPATPRRRPPRP